MSSNNNQKCLACGTEDWGGQTYNIEKLGEIYFCDNHFSQAEEYLDITPPKRFFLAKPLSKKSTAPRFIGDSTCIEEFRNKCKEAEEKGIPYRYGIYCNTFFHDRSWLTNKDYFDGCIYYSDYDTDEQDEDENLLWYWPKEGAEDYEWVINAYQNDNSHVWNLKSKGCVIKVKQNGELFKYCQDCLEEEKEKIDKLIDRLATLHDSIL